MKSKLTYLVLLSIVGLAGATAAETAGVQLSSHVAYALPFGLFISSLVLLTLVTDYTRPGTPLSTNTTRPRLLPAMEAFGAAHPASRRTVVRRRRLAPAVSVF